MDYEDNVYEDGSDAGEVFIRRPVAQPPRGRMNDLLPPGPPMVSTSPPPMKPEMYDGTTDGSEFQIYFDQMSVLFGWGEERCAMMLGICLKEEARVVFVSLGEAQKSYQALTKALMQSFAPKELVQFYQAELKASKKKTEESMADLGKDVAKSVKLAYPEADAATREVIGINSFLEALPGPA